MNLWAFYFKFSEIPSGFNFSKKFKEVAVKVRVVVTILAYLEIA